MCGGIDICLNIYNIYQYILYNTILYPYNSHAIYAYIYNVCVCILYLIVHEVFGAGKILYWIESVQGRASWHYSHCLWKPKSSQKARDIEKKKGSWHSRMAWLHRLTHVKVGHMASGWPSITLDTITSARSVSPKNSLMLEIMNVWQIRNIFLLKRTYFLILLQFKQLVCTS